MEFQFSTFKSELGDSSEQVGNFLSRVLNDVEEESVREEEGRTRHLGPRRDKKTAYLSFLEEVHSVVHLGKATFLPPEGVGLELSGLNQRRNEHRPKGESKEEQSLANAMS